MGRIEEQARKMKLVSPVLAGVSEEQRNHALSLIETKLRDHAEDIYFENKKDIENAMGKVSDAVIKRLRFDEKKLDDVCSGLKMLRELPDPLGKITLNRELDEGLILKRVTCPIGVIGVIFEARPDALIQIASLCIKSGNCALLKGGRETLNTNRRLFSLIHESVTEAGLPGDAYAQAESHAEIDELLSCDKYVDLIIPRGSNAFVKYIMDNTNITVMGHADGICHIYVDESCDEDMAIRIIADAKTQYTAACNAVETVIINRKIAGKFLPKLSKALGREGVRLRGTKEVTDILLSAENSSNDIQNGSGEGIGDQSSYIETISDDDFETEYLDMIVGIRLADDVDEAIEHINRHGSHHTDAIISDNNDNAARFMQMVDSAGVYHNCSTRFSDGFRYGFGAEVGISTGKLHARGPVGLEGLVSYKYELFGSGQTVTEYADGTRTFHHRDISQ